MAHTATDPAPSRPKRDPRAYAYPNSSSMAASRSRALRFFWPV